MYLKNGMEVTVVIKNLPELDFDNIPGEIIDISPEGITLKVKERKKIVAYFIPWSNIDYVEHLIEKGNKVEDEEEDEDEDEE